MRSTPYTALRTRSFRLSSRWRSCAPLLKKCAPLSAIWPSCGPSVLRGARLSSVGRSCAPGVLRVCSAVVALSLSLFGAAACLSSVGRSGSPKTRSVRVGEHLYGEAPFLEVTLQMGVGRRVFRCFQCSALFVVGGPSSGRTFMCILGR